MFSTVYFVASAALASGDTNPNIVSKILDGHIIGASHATALLADADGPQGLLSHENLQIHGDLELALGRQEEAEETYRRALKAIRQDRDGLRIASCRNTGWQAFFRNQFNVAAICFKRIGEDKSASSLQRLDSLVGATLVSFHLGQVRAACGRLAKLTALAAQHDDRRWTYLVGAMRRDLFAQRDLHSAERLDDHIYWRSVLAEFDCSEAPGDAGEPGGIEVPLLAARLSHLRQLILVAEGRMNSTDGLNAHLDWSRKTGLADYHRSLCLEITLAAIAGQARPLAEAMLETSGASGSKGAQHARWYLDYLYCRAKVMQQQMRIQEYSQYYSRYALASIQHVRTDNQSMSVEPTDSTQVVRSDDISARLPAKYRRAYRYLMDNLNQKDLSVREVASQIGVTERAMQVAFKNHLGLSPSELIRRQRMERIRDDLLDNGQSTSRVLEVANKWGVRHRSTLINSYRRVFEEAPSQTIER
ncbi:helix-turn-helix transcriptional regulator [Burkholderia sp. Ac-20384]|uniref:helix-turn-helix transcriptional regulator n=1 Tax=Burkholderia sp. Ac-20384 TaxID=2703902 RepID=UPI00197F62C6|nr:helix-turn-helix transcriptional regulator [Burkholderia sp. Ac-20384]MBN3828234.1 helix-turn-helix transcriptional regulator [Burkholderia sp. Ac-20384]